MHCLFNIMMDENYNSHKSVCSLCSYTAALLYGIYAWHHNQRSKGGFLVFIYREGEIKEQMKQGNRKEICLEGKSVKKIVYGGWRGVWPIDLSMGVELFNKTAPRIQNPRSFGKWFSLHFRSVAPAMLNLMICPHLKAIPLQSLVTPMSDRCLYHHMCIKVNCICSHFRGTALMSFQ